jgi:DNA-binding NtrC family response regulator
MIRIPELRERDDDKFELLDHFKQQVIKRKVLKLEMIRLQRNSPASESWIKSTLYAEEFQLDQMLKLVKKEMINVAMTEHNSNMRKVAEILGLNQTTLYGRMNRVDTKD